MRKLFVDTDIILDLLAKREPHYQSAAELFTLADQGKVQLFVSALSFANLNYIITRQTNQEKARKKLIAFKSLTTVLPLTDKIIELTLVSEFKDFEDGLQYHTATEHQIKKLITRKLKDYQPAEINVMTAAQFLKG